MVRRHTGIVFISLGMAVHALVVGRYLESMFFMAAFPWAWVGFAALRGDLKSAKAMAQTMIGLTIAAGVLLPVLKMAGGNEAALFSLALLPGGICWICVLIYVNHIMSRPSAVATDEGLAHSLDAWAAAAHPPGVHRFADAPVAAEELTPEKIANLVGRDVPQDRESDAA